MNATSETFAGHAIGDRTYTLGEGPTCDAGRDTVWWFDIVGRQLVEYDMAADMLTAHDLPMMASALALVDDDRHVIVNEDGLCLRDVRTGTLSRYLAIEADNTATRSNDARVHASGALWMGTMGKGGEAGAGAIYHVFKGEVTTLYERVSVPNAICFSPDGTTGYFADTKKGTVMQVALDAATGMPVGEPSVFLEAGSTTGGPDGAVIDAQGCMWNARWGAGAVDVHSPDGAHIKSIRVPASRTTCPAFVGKNADRLLVTTAHEGMDEAARKDEPLAGATFLLDEAVSGRAEPRMIL